MEMELTVVSELLINTGKPLCLLCDSGNVEVQQGHSEEKRRTQGARLYPGLEGHWP